MIHDYEILAVTDDHGFERVAMVDPFDAELATKTRQQLDARHLEILERSEITPPAMRLLRRIEAEVDRRDHDDVAATVANEHEAFIYGQTLGHAVNLSTYVVTGHRMETKTVRKPSKSPDRYHDWVTHEVRREVRRYERPAWGIDASFDGIWWVHGAKPRAHEIGMAVIPIFLEQTKTWVAVLAEFLPYVKGQPRWRVRAWRDALHVTTDIDSSRDAGVQACREILHDINEVLEIGTFDIDDDPTPEEWTLVGGSWSDVVFSDLHTSGRTTPRYESEG